MDRQLFIERMKENFIPMSKEEMMKISYRSLSELTDATKIRGSRNILICATEMNELSEELCKYLLEDGDINGILEEYADVQLAIWYLTMLCDLPERYIKIDVNSDATKHAVKQQLLIGDKSNIIEAVCRMSKLAHEIGDYLRGKSKRYRLLDAVSEVQISLIILKAIFDFSDEDISKAMHIKMARVDEDLKRTGTRK